MIRNNDYATRFHFAVLLLAGLLLVPVTARANPERVFDRVSPSIVAVSTDEAVASGIVIAAEGVILTRLSLIDSPTPMRVTAEVSERGKRETRTFKKIEILKVHPEYDVAMIRVLDAGAARFKPVSRSTRPLKADDDIFIVGIAPLSEPEKLERSIEDGQVKKLDEKIDQTSYIRVSAAVTPWSLGGAMCDSSGRVVGMVVAGVNITANNPRTLDLKQIDIGFAAPMKALADRQLVPLNERPKNEQLSKVYQTRGTNWYQIAGRLGTDDRPIALQFALACLRYARSLDPGNLDVLREIGKVWTELEEPALAVAYLKPVAEKKPLDSNNWLSLGRAQLASKDQETRAAAADSLRRGADLPDRSEHHTNQRAPYQARVAFAELMLEQEQWALASYYAVWCEKMKMPGGNGTDDWAKARFNLTDAQITHLSKPDIKFSRDDADLFLELDQSFTTVLTKDQRAKLQAEREALWKQSTQHLEPLAEMRSTALPERPTKVVWVEHATMLAMHFKESQLIGLFDPLTVKITRYLPLPSKNCIVAAGGRRVVALNNDTHELTVWDLADDAGKAKVHLLDLGDMRAVHLTMGRHAPHAAAATLVNDSLEHKPVTFTTIDVDQGQAYLIPRAEYIDGRYNVDQIALYASPWFDAVRCNVNSSQRLALIDGRKMRYVGTHQKEAYQHLNHPDTISFLGHFAPDINPRHASRYKDRAMIPIVGDARWLKRLPIVKDFKIPGIGLLDEQLKVSEEFLFGHPLNADFVESSLQPPVYAHAALRRAVIVPDDNRAYVIPFILPTKETP